MSQTYYTLVTNLGAALLAQATTLGTKLKLTHVAVGDGNGNLPSPSVTQKKLVNEKRRGAINAIYVDSDNANQIIIEQVIPPEEGGFYIREIGLFDENNNLIAVGNCPPSYKPVLSEGSGRTQVINMVIIVDNTGSVELKIDASSVVATRKYVDDLITTKMEKSLYIGDYGLGATTQKNTPNIDIDTYDFRVGFYSGNNWTASVNSLPFGSTSSNVWFYLINQNLASAGSNYKLQILGLNNGAEFRLAYRYKVGGIVKEWVEVASLTTVKEAYELADKALPKSGGTSTGNQRIEKITPSLTLKDTASGNITAFVVDSNVFRFHATGSDGYKQRVSFNVNTNIWNFENVEDVTINKKSVLKLGDYGVGAATQNNTTGIDIDSYDFKTGFYSGNKWTAGVNGLPFGITASTDWFYLLNQNLASNGSNYKLQILGNALNGRLAFRNVIGGSHKPFQEFITHANIADYVQNKVVAWGRFDYSTNNAINIIASNGISSVTRTATGKYTVTLSNEIADTKYIVIGNSQQLLKEDATFANTFAPMHLRSQVFEIWCGDNNQDKFFDTGNCYFAVIANA